VVAWAGQASGSRGRSVPNRNLGRAAVRVTYPAVSIVARK
jgi:hypothetical protein